MYRVPGRAFVPLKVPINKKQSIDAEAKTRILSNANGATEGSQMSKTIITGVANKTSITPLENLTVGFDVVGEEMPDIREMSHRDLIVLEQKNNSYDNKKQSGSGLKLAGKGMGIVSFCAEKNRKTQKGKGNTLAGRGDLPSTFYNEILPALLNHLNIPADSKNLKRLMNITKADFEKTQDTKRLIDMVTEDYAKLLSGGRMTGAGMNSLNKNIKKALIKSMRGMGRGEKIVSTIRNFYNDIKPYVRPAVEVGKWAWRNRDAIKDIALAVL